MEPMRPTEAQLREFQERFEREVREIERGLETGDYEMVMTRLLFELHVIDPSHRAMARSIPELERLHGSQYVLADGRRIEELTSTERAALYEFEVEQPRKVEPAPADC